MKRRVSAFSVLVSLLGVFLLYLVIPNVGPVLEAARNGAGVQGTFTAQRLNCVQHPGHTACNWQGDFRSDNGTVTRNNVFLYGGAEGLTAGRQVKARDVGRAGQVYRPAGSHEWIVSALLALVGVLLLLKGGFFGLAPSAFPSRRRGAARRSPSQRPAAPSVPTPSGAEPSHPAA